MFFLCSIHVIFYVQGERAFEEELLYNRYSKITNSLQKDIVAINCTVITATMDMKLLNRNQGFNTKVNIIFKGIQLISGFYSEGPGTFP